MLCLFVKYMEIHADLHAHSAFAGGARAGGKTTDEQRKRIQKRFVDAAIYSPLKGVNLIGTGDAQFDPWLYFLRVNLDEHANGIFTYGGEINNSSFLPDDEIEPPKYILQTELIFTGPIPNSNKKKRVHVVILFPHFDAIRSLNQLLDDWGVARKNMARPFIVCSSTDEVNMKVQAILDIDPLVEMIPAHVLTPEGVYGGNNRINYMSEFFGDAHQRFHAIETGLSADPSILGLISELDRYTLISNADAHSAALNRVGREFTTYDLNKLDYPSLIDGIRRNKVLKTAEFHPTEGRYFLTGHRDLRKRPGEHKKNQFCYFSPKHLPNNDVCPICKKELTVGVLQRAFEISEIQGLRKIGDGPKRDFVTMVPLIEIIGHYFGIKTLTSKKVLRQYKEVIEFTGTEVQLWTDEKIIENLYGSKIPNKLVDQISQVRNGNFMFEPVGFDGVYGVLKIGSTINFEDLKKIENK